MSKRKIIEIYVDEDEINENATFDIKKVDESEIADNMMRSLIIMFSKLANEEE